VADDEIELELGEEFLTKTQVNTNELYQDV
jgi:hypothetical protein